MRLRDEIHVPAIPTNSGFAPGETRHLLRNQAGELAILPANRKSFVISDLQKKSNGLDHQKTGQKVSDNVAIIAPRDEPPSRTKQLLLTRCDLFQHRFQFRKMKRF